MSKKETKPKKISDLTDEEVKFLASEIFRPKKVTCVRRSRRDDEASCKIYLEWDDDEAPGKTFVTADEVTFKNPFLHGYRSILADFSLAPSDFLKLRQFCFAKGITEGYEDLSVDNPYLENRVEMSAP